jgi:hypothetical protein
VLEEPGLQLEITDFEPTSEPAGSSTQARRGQRSDWKAESSPVRSVENIRGEIFQGCQVEEMRFLDDQQNGQ